VRAKRQERAHRLNGSRSFSQRSCRAPQSRIQPTISRGWASFGRFGHRSTESFEKQKSKTARRAHTVSPVPVSFACGRGQRPRGAPCAAAVKGEPSPGPASKHTAPTAHACIKIAKEALCDCRFATCLRSSRSPFRVLVDPTTDAK